MGPLLSTLVLIGVCATIGVRLALLASRTRGLPELLIGLAFLLAGIFGVALELVHAIAPLPPAAGAALADAASLGMHAAVSCIAAFTWRVFHPADGSGRALFAAAVALLLASLASEIAQHHQPAADATLRAVASLGVRAAVYVWASLESGRYWLPLRRQLRIGLGDPLVASRMLCWTIGTLSIALGWLRIIAVTLVAPSAAREVGSFFTTFLLLICAGAYWMAFFPPARLPRWVAGA